MTAPRVHIVCQNYGEDRIIPRMARALSAALGWTLNAAPDPKANVLYLSGYFEAQRLRQWPSVPVAAYFTHKEEEPKGNAKAKLFDEVAGRVQLRVAMCELYAAPLREYGPTVTPPLPVERERFTIAARTQGKVPIVGFSGYTYPNRRKGEDLVKGIIGSNVAQRVEWRASGRGWPVPTKRLSWAEMPSFYQDLDVLVCPSRVEGGPMPVLEALSCGVRVVIPRGVGILDEIPETPGVYRYERGDLETLLVALEAAAFPTEPIDREALREAVALHSVEAFVEAHARAFGEAFGVTDDRAGIAEGVIPAESATVTARPLVEPVERGTGSTRGIYCVAFGEPSRWCAELLMKSIKAYMPDIPIALCAAKPIGLEDVFIQEADSDVGGRRAKLKAYELAPAEWESVLYLDADTEVVAPIYQYFQWVEDGWELVICKDPHLMDELTAFERRNNRPETEETAQALSTWRALQFNGGVWAFGRSERIARFFQRWQDEWERHAQRDQGALLRALYADPLRVWLLGNEWNTFPKYSRGVTTAGLMHYPGDARRWNGLIPGRIDSKEAWAMAESYERKWKAEHR
jgi:hypothetical protein